MAKKLDQAMANLEWRMAFPEATTEVLNRHHSDHNPLFMRYGPPPKAEELVLSGLKHLGLPI